jgi:arsenite methyltransferase
MTDNNDNIHRLVEDRYAAFAVASDAGLSACEPGSDTWGKAHYDDLSELPDAAVLASLGCGNPTAVLRPGDRVLDLGSGGGIDVLISAKRVGPTGYVYGLDMTVEMLDLARRNAA